MMPIMWPLRRSYTPADLEHGGCATVIEPLFCNLARVHDMFISWFSKWKEVWQEGRSCRVRDQGQGTLNFQAERVSWDKKLGQGFWLTSRVPFWIETLLEAQASSRKTSWKNIYTSEEPTELSFISVHPEQGRVLEAMSTTVSPLISPFLYTLP